MRCCGSEPTLRLACARASIIVRPHHDDVVCCLSRCNVGALAAAGLLQGHRCSREHGGPRPTAAPDGLLLEDALIDDHALGWHQVAKRRDAARSPLQALAEWLAFVQAPGTEDLDKGILKVRFSLPPHGNPLCV